MGAVLRSAFSPGIRRAILRGDALFLMIAASAGLYADVQGIVYSRGPQGRILIGAPLAGIGFVEAHGLALIFGVVLWRSAPARFWHLTAAAIHLLLGTANLAFWQIFVSAQILTTGYVTTTLHFLFVALQAVAAVFPREGQVP